MTESKLLELEPMEAQKQLTEERLEKYNQLKRQNLEENLQNKKSEDARNSAEGLAAMKKQAQQGLIFEVCGIEFTADINPTQLAKLRKVKKFDHRKEAELTEGEYSEIIENVLDVLADLSVNQSRQDWQEEFGHEGLATIGNVIEPLMNKLEKKLEQKKSR